MWLSSVLWRRWTPGNQRIGKHRKVMKMTATRKRNIVKREQQEQDVLLQLSRPCLTQEEERGSASVRRNTDYIPKWVQNVRQRWMDKQTTAFNELQGTNN